MTFPSSEPILPEEDHNLPPARRRRLGHSLPLHGSEERKGSLASIAYQVTPSIDYYLGFLLAGILAATAILLDAPALYVLAALFTPFLGPVFGIPFSAFSGSGKFFFNSLASLLVGAAIVFGFGALAGIIAQNLPVSGGFSQTGLHSRFDWADLALLAIGSAVTIYLLMRSPRQKPLVANIAVAYELVLPLAVSGFSLTSGLTGDWMAGLSVFLAHLALAFLIAVILLFILGLKPALFFGYTLTTTLVLVGIIVIGVLAGVDKFISPPPAEIPMPVATSTTTATAAATSTPQPAQTVEQTKVVLLSTETILPSATPTPTVTFAPTPVWAKIDAPSGGGAFIREEPNGKIITSLVNGSPVTVISEPLRIQGGTIWVKIRTENGVVGWIMQSLLATATPAPGW